MCRYQTLFHDPKEGYVVLCRECNHIQVGFGNIMLTLNDQGFRSLLNYLNDCREVLARDNGIRNVRIPTPAEGIQLILNREELYCVIRIFEKAETEWQTDALLQLFNHQGLGNF